MLKRQKTNQPKTKPASPWKLAIAGAILGTLLTTLIFAPARWLASAIASATNQRVLLTDTSGSIWNGTAKLTLSAGSGSSGNMSLPTPLNWKIKPSLTSAAVLLSSQCCTPNEEIAMKIFPKIGGANLEINNTRSTWPSELLAGLGTPFNTLDLKGKIELESKNIQITIASGRATLNGALEIFATNISSRLSTVRPLGSYQISINGQNGQTNMALKTLNGALILEGSGQWVGQRLRFSGIASAKPEFNAQLASLLNVIGQRSGDKAIITLG